MEALQANVERLNAYKSKLVVFPKSGKAEEATQFQGVFMPVEKVAPKVEFVAVSDAMKKNSAFLGRGICFNKFTGSRGKSGANDAAAELVGKVRKLFNDHGVVYQTSELGKVDQGGGGTIAYIMANYDMDVIDAGVAMLSMHAPWEIVSKADVYMTSRAYHEFFVNYR